MPEIRKIEIVCLPCHKCEVMKEKILNILRAFERKTNMRMHCEIITYTDRKTALKEINKYGYGMNKLPVTLINGEVAFMGSMVSEQEIRVILEGIIRY